MLVKLIVVIAIFLILASLVSGVVFLVRDLGESKRIVKALTWRIAVSLLLFLFLFLAFALGWLKPHGL